MSRFHSFVTLLLVSVLFLSTALAWMLIHAGPQQDSETTGCPDISYSLPAQAGVKFPTWQPSPNKYLFAACTIGRLSNRIICIQRHLAMAVALNRTLVIPEDDLCPNTRPTYSPYNMSLSLDFEHLKKCTGGRVIPLAELERQREYQKRLEEWKAEFRAAGGSNDRFSHATLTRRRLLGAWNEGKAGGETAGQVVQDEEVGGERRREEDTEGGGGKRQRRHSKKGRRRRNSGEVPKDRVRFVFDAAMLEDEPWLTLNDMYRKPVLVDTVVRGLGDNSSSMVLENACSARSVLLVVGKMEDMTTAVAQGKTRAWPAASITSLHQQLTSLGSQFDSAAVLSLGDLFNLEWRDMGMGQFLAPASLHALSSCPILFQPPPAVMQAAKWYMREYVGVNYAALHLRRTDMKDVDGAKYWSLASVSDCAAARMAPLGLKVLFVASDAGPSEMAVLRGLLAAHSIAMLQVPREAEELRGVAAVDDLFMGVEKMVAANARVMMYSDYSSFSSHVRHLRQSLGLESCWDGRICDQQYWDPRLHLTTETYVY